MQGIYFAFQGSERNILKTLLNGIDFTDYQFEVNHFQAKKESFLHPDWAYYDNKCMISSDDAKKRLLEDESDYERIENLSLYVRNKAIRKKRIQTFKDLVEGKYELALKVVDHNTVHVYSTSNDVINKIMSNAKTIDYSHASIKPYECIDFSTVLGM